ncbi:MAG: hypothetical protein ABI247_03920 [Rhodanobacter sp.]
MQVAEHEIQRILGLRLALSGLAPGHIRAHRQASGDRHTHYRSHGHGQHPSTVAMSFALNQDVKGDPQHPRNQSQFRVGFTVRTGACVCGDRFGALASKLSVLVERESQCRTETFFRVTTGLVAGVRLSTDDQAKNPFCASAPLERQYFLVDPS